MARNNKLAPTASASHEGNAVKNPQAPQGSNVVELGAKQWTQATLNTKLNSVRSGSQSATDIIIGMRKGFVDGTMLAELLETDRKTDNVRGLSQTKTWNALKQAFMRLKAASGKEGASDDAKLFLSDDYSSISCGDGIVQFKATKSNAGGNTRKPGGATAVTQESRKSQDGQMLDTDDSAGEETHMVSFEGACGALLAHLKAATLSDGVKMAAKVVELLNLAGYKTTQEF